MSDENKHEDYGEPWECKPNPSEHFGPVIYDANGNNIIGMSKDHAHLGIRVAACVSACAGIPTRHLHGAIAKHKSIISAIERVENPEKCLSGKSTFYVRGDDRCYRVTVERMTYEEAPHDGTTEGD